MRNLKTTIMLLITFVLSLTTILAIHNFGDRKTNLVESQILEQNINPQSALAAKPALGINPDGLAYFSTQWVFVDIMKQSSTWITQNITPGGPFNTKMIEQIPVDENGYPLELPLIASNGIPQKVVTILGNASYPSGDYLLLFEGEGEIEIFGKNLKTQKEGPGRYRITRTDGDRINVAIVKSVKGNHLRNMRVIMPGFEDNYEEQIFHPLFLERLQPFTVLRFINLMRANHNTIITWEDRTRPSSYTQADSGHGIAPEYIAKLANKIQADAWINIPHQADDNYIRELAKLLKQDLDLDQKIYVEYSNELWNGLFEQTKWLYKAGCENPDTFVPAQGDNDQGIPGCNDFLSSVNLHVKKLARIAEIFDEVFQDSFDDRIIVVAASQAVSPYLSEQLLKGFSNTKLNPKGYKPAALAVAPYFSIKGTVKFEPNVTVDEMLNLAQEHIETGVLNKALKQKQIADQYNVALIAYEGGQHLVARPRQKQTPLTQTMIEANRNPRMGDLYRKYLKSWFDTVGGGLFVHFSYVYPPGPHGSWGALEFQDQPISEAPKYQALLDTVEYLPQKTK
jgi:hypothetical protein